MPAGTLDKGEKSNPQRGGYNPDPAASEDRGQAESDGRSTGKGDKSAPT